MQTPGSALGSLGSWVPRLPITTPRPHDRLGGPFFGPTMLKYSTSCKVTTIKVAQSRLKSKIAHFFDTHTHHETALMHSPPSNNC